MLFRSLSFAVLMPAIWSSLMPGRLALIILVTKPEFWLQITMFVLFADLIRPEILFLCLLLNVWGILVFFLHTRKQFFPEFTYESFRQDCVDAEGEELAKRMDKMAGYSLNPKNTIQP